MRLEWGLIEHYPEVYGAVRGDAARVQHVDNVLDETWATVHESFRLLPAVLAADRQATDIDPTCGQVYYDAFHGSMHRLVAQRMQRSQELVASVWLTAWEDAGRPELPVAAAEPDVERTCPLRGKFVVYSSTVAFALLLGWAVVRYLRLRRMTKGG
jgi:hypothetical protein